MSAFETQVDGNHYSKLAIQPMQYSMANKLDACQHTIIKYVTRFRDKNGKADLEKAKHVIDMLIELEYPTPKKIEPEFSEWFDRPDCQIPNSNHFVEVEFRNGTFQEGCTQELYWDMVNSEFDIIRYRIIHPTMA